MPALLCLGDQKLCPRTDNSRSGSADLLRREPSREIGAHIVKRFAQTATLPLRERHARVFALPGGPHRILPT